MLGDGRERLECGLDEPEKVRGRLLRVACRRWRILAVVRRSASNHPHDRQDVSEGKLVCSAHRHGNFHTGVARMLEYLCGARCCFAVHIPQSRKDDAHILPE